MSLVLIGCSGHDLYMPDRDIVDENARRVFGIEFDPLHDWCVTVSGVVDVYGIPEGAGVVSLYGLFDDEGHDVMMLLLDRAYVGAGESSVSISYDVPVDNLGLYVGIGSYFRKVVDGSCDFGVSPMLTRAGDGDPFEYVLPDESSLVVGESVPSYASSRGWVPGELLYGMSGYAAQKMDSYDYPDEFKELFRSVIFSHFRNGRQYDNLHLVKESGFYNGSAYPFTTGKEPIVVTPVYKRDGSPNYGCEVYNSDLYYYYYKDSWIGGADTVSFLQSLPKYKLLPFNECYVSSEDDVLERRGSYALVYWGDGVPEVGVTTGSYQFPEGYKIGFMVRSKTTVDGGNKQGELYGDGRLNNRINTYSKTNFKSSKLGQDGPRVAWITLDGRMLMCWESGTDADFNDVILEVEGGVEPIEYIPEYERGYYTFCFEDTEIGDYDMNDVVIRASRLDETHVEYSLVACGAYDALKVMNIEGTRINSGSEVHGIFGVGRVGVYINTMPGGLVCSPVVDTVVVKKTFSFLDESTQPYIYDMTTGKYVYLAKAGQDPHGIMVPWEFRYPLEKVCVKDAYLEFNSWGANRVTSTSWYMRPEEDKVW